MVVSLSTLTPAELEEFAELKAECDKNHTDYALDNEYVLSVLEASQMCANSGRNLLKKIHLWRTSKDGILPGVTSIFDVAAFYKNSQLYSDGPDAILYILEDCKGNCARDRDGRPIVVLRGMLYGSVMEQLQLTEYMISRAANYQIKDRSRSLCIIFDLTHYEGCTDTFRLPDKNVMSLMDKQKNYYPEYMGISNVAVVGLPKLFAQIMEVMRMRLGYGNAWTFFESFDALRATGQVSSDNLPPAFGGTFDFDFNKYLRWRAMQEGVSWERIEAIKARTFQSDVFFSASHRNNNGAGMNNFNFSGEPSYQALVGFMKTAKYNAAHSCILTIDNKPRLAVLLPWCELRVYKGTDLANPGKILRCHFVSEETSLELYTDFVYEPSCSETENSSANQSQQNSGGNVTYSAWYTLSLGYKEGPNLEAIPTPQPSGISGFGPTATPPPLASPAAAAGAPIDPIIADKSNVLVNGWNEFSRRARALVAKSANDEPLIIEARTELEKKNLQLLVDLIQTQLDEYNLPTVAGIAGAPVSMDFSEANEKAEKEGENRHWSTVFSSSPIYDLQREQVSVSELSSDSTGREPTMASSLEMNWGGLMAFLGSSPPQ